MSGRWWTIIAAVVIAGAGLLAYSNSFSVPFVFDDFANVADNPNIRKLWPIWETLSPPHQKDVAGRPVAYLSFALNYAVGGLNVRGYHVVNLGIHLLAALALFGVVRRTLSLAALRERFGSHATPLAAAAALLWLLHPLQTESVTYIVQRYESLMGLFFLLTLYGAVRGMEGPGGRGWLAASVVFCALGMATKERMVVAPLMVLLYDRAFLSGTFAEALGRRPRYYLWLAGTWAVLAVLVTQAARVPGGFDFGVTPWDYAMIQIPTVVHYLQLSFWPSPLVLDYGHPLPQALPQIVLPLVILSALLAVTAFAAVRRPTVGFAGAWFFLFLAPTSSVIPNWESVEEHHTYLPLAGVCVLVVAAVYLAGAWVLRRSAPSERARSALGWSVGVALVVAAAGALGWATFLRNHDYRSELALWDDTVRKLPENPRAHASLGQALVDAGHFDEGIAQCREALRLDPKYALAFNNIGYAYQRQGLLDKAIPYFRDAVRYDPEYGMAYYNLACGLLARKRFEEALPYCRQAVRFRSKFTLAAYNNLGIALRNLGRLDEAAPWFERALRLDARFAPAHYNLGSVLLQQGRLDGAARHFVEAVRIDPDYTYAYNDLGAALARMGRSDEAIASFKEAIRTDPSYAQAHYGLGFMLLRQGRAAEAVPEFQEALRLKPDFEEARRNLDAARRALP